MIRKRKNITSLNGNNSLIVNFRISIIVHLLLRGCQLSRCYFSMNIIKVLLTGFCHLEENYSTYWVFVSCGILMPKYVITVFLIYFIQYKKLAWGGRNYVEKILSCLNKRY